MLSDRRIRAINRIPPPTISVENTEKEVSKKHIIATIFLISCKLKVLIAYKQYFLQK